MRIKSQHFIILTVLAVLLPSTILSQPLPVKTVEFMGDSIGRKLKYNIILPASYEKSADRYPVLYLLHGLTGDYTGWARMGAASSARIYELIVVMPDGGNSWYVNWAKSDEGQKNNWDDYITKDLIAHIDSTYRTIARREGRAICGLSMGGYGGLMLGLKHPDLFCAIGSESGALSFAKGMSDRIKAGGEVSSFVRNPTNTPNPRIGVDGFSSQADRTPRGKLFTTAEECAAYDPFELVLKVPKEKLPHIYIDCGTEDGLMASSLAFVKVLTDNKIPYTFAQSPGAHNGAYWSREIGQVIAVQYGIIQRNLASIRQSTGAERGR